MAKGVYIGVDNKARKVKQMYVGVETQTYNDPNTILLLHGESIVDSSPKGQTITNNGVTVSTAQSKFGGSSLYFNGSSTLRLPALNFGTGDFTVDFWIYPSAISGYFLSGYSTGLTGSFGVGFRNTTTIGVLKSSVAWDTEATVSISTNKWTHLAFVRKAGTVYLFVNGSLVGSGSNTNDYFTSTATVIGAEGSSGYYKGYVDEYRISNVARWTSNFSVPTSPYEIYEVEKPVARRVKKGYIGIGGVARPFWGGGELTYYGTVTSLSMARSKLATTTIGNYALFGGGEYSSTSNVVDAYNSSLTRTVLSSPLRNVSKGLAATTVGNYALFGGGYGNGFLKIVTSYDASLTRGTASDLTVARSNLVATTVGNYALFCGGQTTSGCDAVVNTYNTSLTRGALTTSTNAHYSGGGTAIGNYALIAGGCNANDSRISSVDAYDKSLTRTTPTALSKARSNLASTTVGNYALFGGGQTYGDAVDAYNKSLTRTNPSALSNGRINLSATTIGEYALFAGGYLSGSVFGTVDAYDASLTRKTPTELNKARYCLSAATVGNYALFGGGHTGDGYSAVVDAYSIV